MALTLISVEPNQNYINPIKGDCDLCINVATNNIYSSGGLWSYVFLTGLRSIFDVPSNYDGVVWNVNGVDIGLAVTPGASGVANEYILSLTDHNFNIGVMQTAFDAVLPTDDYTVTYTYGSSAELKVMVTAKRPDDNLCFTVFRKLVGGSFLETGAKVADNQAIQFDDKFAQVRLNGECIADVALYPECDANIGTGSPLVLTRAYGSMFNVSVAQKYAGTAVLCDVQGQPAYDQLRYTFLSFKVDGVEKMLTAPPTLTIDVPTGVTYGTPLEGLVTDFDQTTITTPQPQNFSDWINTQNIVVAANVSFWYNFIYMVAPLHTEIEIVVQEEYLASSSVICGHIGVWNNFLGEFIIDDTETITDYNDPLDFQGFPIETNYRHYPEVFGGLATEQVTLKFEYSSIIAPYIESPTPQLSGVTAWQIVPNFSQQFEFGFYETERANRSNSFQGLVQTDAYYVNMSADTDISFNNFDTLASFGETFFPKVGRSEEILTFCAGRPEFWYCFLEDGWQVEIRDLEGTVYATQLINSGGLNRQLYYVDISPILALIPEGDFVDLYVAISGFRFTEVLRYTRAYNKDKNLCCCNEYFVFENQYGVPEFFPASCQIEEGYSVRTDTYLTCCNPKWNVTATEADKIETYASLPWDTNADTLAYVKAFFDSPKAYYYDGNGFTEVLVQPQSQSFELSQNRIQIPFSVLRRNGLVGLRLNNFV